LTLKAIADLPNRSTPICGLSTRNPKEPLGIDKERKMYYNIISLLHQQIK